MSSTYPSNEYSSSADFNSLIGLIVVTLIVQLSGLVLSIYKLRLANKRHKKYHISSTGSIDLEDGQSNIQKRPLQPEES